MNKKSIIFILALLLGGIELWAQTPEGAPQPTPSEQSEEVASAPAEEAEVAKVAIDPNAPLADYSAPKRYIIRNITAEGIKFLDAEMQINSSGLAKGDVVSIPGREISQAISRLWSKQYFSDVQVYATPVGDSVDLSFVLAERPRIYNWLFEGISKSAATTLIEDFKLKRGAETLSDHNIEKRINQIKDHYVHKGWRNVEVIPRIENDSVIKNAVNVTFVINRNEKVRIGELDFEGNEAFSDKQLRRVMKKIHKKSINIFHNTKLREDELEEDFGNIIDFYNSKGYRNAMIVKDSVYVISPERIGLVITVDEGNKYYYRNIKWVGNSTYPTEQLNSMLGIKSGDAYDKKTLYERLGVGKEDDPEDVSTIKIGRAHV